MDIPALIQLMQNKVTILSNAKALAFSSGDLDRMNAIENDLLGTQNTLSQLQMLLDATRAANTSSLDLSSVVTAGVQAAQSASMIPETPAAVLSQYDMSIYAADPLYIQKITDMLTYMPTFDNASQIDAYIDKEVVGSPITGQMVIDATTKYVVDPRLTVAIMELDSRFGTAGVGAKTFNPGNVGNTGTSISTYASWADGVAAVAYWLSRHRAGGPVPVADKPADPVVQDAPVVAPEIVPAIVPPAVNPTPAATSTSPVASSTTPFVPPPVPVSVVSTSTDPVVLTPVDPIITSTSTNPTATSTSPVGDPGNATSTPPFFNPGDNGSNATSTATSTSPAASTTPSTGTTTSPFTPPDSSGPGNTSATTTPVDANATTTQAKRSAKRGIAMIKRV